MATAYVFKAFMTVYKKQTQTQTQFLTSDTYVGVSLHKETTSKKFCTDRYAL
jgi:hypothetical protein